MIAKHDILKDLDALDLLYQKASGLKEPLFYSKLAIIELCGWVEMTMDDIVLTCAKLYVRETRNLNWLEKEIKKVSGFTYEDHFRKMLLWFIGIACLEMMEAQLDSAKFDMMKSKLTALKNIRNPVAHTHLKGTATTLNAPSITISYFNPIYEGLNDIESKLITFKPFMFV